jgi:N-acetylglucosamine PTS system EIICBA or EIICB component
LSSPLTSTARGVAYNRYSGIQLPSYLAFFGGRRFVPIVSAGLGLIFGIIVGSAVDSINGGVDSMSRAVLASGGFGLFAYGFLNCILRITGLHHIINNIAWFVVGEFNGKSGDLTRFYAGDPTAGSFMAGFYPVMMFGLPAACFAMYRAALPENRPVVGGMFLSAALTVFLTGVTEPIEFMFVFVAPVLFLIHAILTGISMVLLDAMNVKLGFGFSAGLFDYVLNFNLSTNPLLMLPVGLAYALIYYFVFSFAISKFDLKTPGREPSDAADADASWSPKGSRGEMFIAALGGDANLRSIDACLTRLRLIVNDQTLVNDDRLRTLGAKGIVRLSADAIQVVLGPEADAVASDIRSTLQLTQNTSRESMPVGAPVDSKENYAVSGAHDALIEALGGSANIKAARSLGGRVVVRVADTSVLNEPALLGLCPQGITWTDSESLHLLAGIESQNVAAIIRGRLTTV